VAASITRVLKNFRLGLVSNGRSASARVRSHMPHWRASTMVSGFESLPLEFRARVPANDEMHEA
jgi:hypothetical protein